MEKVIIFTFNIDTGECQVNAKGFTRESHKKGANVINKLLGKEIAKSGNFEHEHTEGHIHEQE